MSQKVRTIDELRRHVAELYKDIGNWRDVSVILGVKHPTAYRLANEPGYEPKDPHIRHILNLPAIIPTPACPKCGVVHTRKTCPAKRPATYTDLFSMPRKVLRWKLENREEL